jgi:Chaperone of endosialidase
VNNNSGDDNTAIGFQALDTNTTGSLNTANGVNALFNNTTGGNNTANGVAALFHNITGDNNTANGVDALAGNGSGGNNTANGFEALFSNTTGNLNVGLGVISLLRNTTGNFNTANGVAALQNNTTGGGNIALGFNAGGNLTIGNNNIDIGNLGVAAEANTVRVGTQGTHRRAFIAGISGIAVTGSPVVVNAGGQLGVAASSERFKDEIKPMNKMSEAILALKPVTFRYKKDIDPEGRPQFGLLAEDVEKLNRDLVVRDSDGKLYTVRYDAINVMLLNEFLKEHKKTEKLEATVASLIATVKEQAAQIQKVSAQLESSKPAPQVVNNP